MSTIIFILFLHWVADFLLQSDWMATNKSKNNAALLTHTFSYSVMWILMAFFLPPMHVVYFMGITFVCHTITDYFTSRLNSKLWAEKKVHWFFVSVGFDQFLHFAQLLLTYQLLKP